MSLLTAEIGILLRLVDVYNGNNAASTVAHIAYARPSPSPGAHGHPAALSNAYGSTNYQLPAPQPTNNPNSNSSYNSYTNTMPSQHANNSYALSVHPPNPSTNSYNSYSPAIASSPTPPPPQNGRPATVPGLSFKDQLQVSLYAVLFYESSELGSCPKCRQEKKEVIKTPKTAT